MTSDSHQSFSFAVRFTLKANRNWWNLSDYVHFEYTRDAFILEVVKRQDSFYELITWLTMHPSRWADFVNTFDIEYKERR